jgi:hypothetical protein
MQQAQGRHGFGAEGREGVFRQVERQGQPAHQPLPENEHMLEIGLHGGPERRRPGRPEIGPVIELAGADARIVRGVLGTDVEPFLEVRRSARLEGLAPERLVAAVRPGAGLVRGKLLFGRQRKEAPRFGEDRGDEIFGHAVVANVKEAVVEAGGAQGAGHLLPLRPARACQSVDVDHRQRPRIGGDRRGLLHGWLPLQSIEGMAVITDQGPELTVHERGRRASAGGRS